MTRFPMAMVFFLLPFFSSGSKADILQSPPQNLVHATFMIVSALPAFSNPTLSSFTLGTTSRPPPSQASAVFTKRQQGGGILSLSFAIPAPAPTPSPNLIPNGAVIPLLLIRQLQLVLQDFLPPSRSPLQVRLSPPRPPKRAQQPPTLSTSI